MGKSKKNRAVSTNQIQHKSQTSAEAFSFGDPVPVLDWREPSALPCITVHQLR